MQARVPANEQKRLEALRRYRVLDTPPEKEFDDITRVATYIAKTPISTITLIDEARQWFKSVVGLDSTETTRDVSFCAHAILQSEPLVVPDARLNPTFANNPLVLNEPKIQFYAGYPLVTPEGLALGTLCVIDRKPSSLTPEQSDALRCLANQVVTSLELRKASADLAASLESVKTLSGLVPICCNCKGVRDDAGYWQQVEQFLSTKTDAMLSHSICPACVEKLYPEHAEKLLKHRAQKNMQS
jgi:hypothetical protein